MKDQQSQAIRSSSRVLNLLVWAGALLLFSPPAQTQEACPLPAGVTPPPDPRVTAQQVEAGSATLKDFALAVRDQSIGLPEAALYLQCRIRQEGSPYRSGSTYLVHLTPDGRVYEHAKSMALSGRLLNPLIYAEILNALGVSPTVLANLTNPDPAIAAQAGAAVIHTLLQEPDAAFDATVPVPGLRPGIPRARGHAAVYLLGNSGLPILLLAGFDLDESHLIPIDDEAIDYGNPTITARDVVDRETLKAFVTQAGEWLVPLVETATDPAAISKARIALRDPNGPWRHGPVYLYVLDLTSNIILFHGAFPDRFEWRPLVATVRDAVTGELILPQVIEAAQNNPEGGFLRYYFDDPADDSDNADIPKVGYAREFALEVPRPDGTVIPLNVIIGSGFYLSSPNVVAARQNKVLETVLPQIMRTMTASTVDAVSGRIHQASSGKRPEAAFRLGGASTLSDALLANGPALGNGALDLNWLLADSSFNLPLNQSGAGSGQAATLTLWGSADYRNISDDNMQATAYDGDVVSAHLGIDSRVSDTLLGGVSLSLARGTVDYTDVEQAMGEFTTSLSSINPYVGWTTSGGTVLWAIAGYGWGEVEFEETTNSQASDMTQRMVAAGVSRSLAASERLIAGGATNLMVKAETAFTRADVEGGGSLRSMKLDASRHRLMLEGAHTRTLASEATLTPSVELGVRYDGGDGETGGGLEVGAGIGYTAGRLSVKVNARTLVSHSQADEYEEWGFSGLLAYQARSDGRGLSVTLGSTWGVADSGVRSLWSGRPARALARSRATLNEGPFHQPALHEAALREDPLHETALHEAALIPAQRFRAELRYGLNGPGGLGLWLPYLGGDSGGGFRALRLGLQLRSGQGFETGLEVSRRESLYLPVDHAIELRGIARW